MTTSRSGRLTRAVGVLMLLSMPYGAQTADQDAEPLAPPDTSSPRATIASFADNVETAFRPYYLHQDRSDPFGSPAGKRALGCLDRSELPPAQAERLAYESVLLLADTLGRVELPPSDEIPGAEEMAELPDDARRAWRIPGTAMEIARVTEGENKGEYLFTPETVRRAREFFERSQDLPYRPDAMVGLYERVVFEPGEWLPGRWVRALPGWAKRPLGELAVWQWLGLLLSITVWGVAVLLVAHFARRRSAAKPSYWRAFFITLLLLPLTLVLRSVVDDELKIVGHVYSLVDPSLVMVAYLICAAASIALGSAIGEAIIESPRVDSRSIDAHLIRMISRMLAWLAAIAFVLTGAAAIGVPLTAVVTGLGVGGLAFALAARPTLENLVAGITLFVDKPVRVGTFCAFEDVVGQVEEIGMRSTRIRRWGGNRITIPNAKFAELRLDNYDDTSKLLIRTKLGLRYETTPDQLRFVLAGIREMLVAHAKLTGSPRARLSGFGDYALEIEILAYADTGDWSEWHAIREDVFLRIIDIVEEAGTGIALPSQTNYLARDKGLDHARGQDAERAVREWREAGELPFPDIDAARRAALAGSLDFPPRGSVARRAETTVRTSPPHDDS